MKNKNLSISPKKLETSPGSPEIMINTTKKQGKLFLFRILCHLWQFEIFVAFPYKLLMLPMSLLCLYSLIYAQLSTLAWATCNHA